MGQISLEAVTVGQPDSTEEPKIPGNFRTLQDLVNGNIDATNLAAAAGVSATQLAAAVQQALFAPGDLKTSVRTTPGTGWLLCDGAAVSRTTYRALFDEIRETWGAGDRSTTFNVPDLRGRAMIMAGTGTGLTARTLAQRLGVETHRLTISEMPAHAHTVATDAADPDHTHASQSGTAFLTDNVTGRNGVYDATAGGNRGFGNAGGGFTGAADAALNHAHGIRSEGGGGTHENMQPSAVVNVFVKT
jgi:microcystin-dependent protein